MIDNNEVYSLLNGQISERLICYQFELRPSVLAPDIKQLANIVENYGFIVLGVSKLENSYQVNGISRGLNVDKVIYQAVQMLAFKPEIEICSMIISCKNIYVIKVYRIDGGTSLLQDKLNDPTITEFIDRLYKFCVGLQGNSLYIDASEDQRNDYIRDMLSQFNYVIKDQTRRGISSSGISSGEIDILVEKDKSPFTIIEALNLSSMDKEYLAKHLNKIYTYDTTGNPFNVCLTYAKVKNFASFWEKYCDFVKGFQYPYPINSCDENIDSRYIGSEIRMMTTTHNRSGMPTKLYHICVKILA